MANPEAIAAAEKIIGPVLAKTLVDQIAEGNLLGEVGKLASELVFQNVWGRPGLNNHQRSLVTIAILLARRRHDILKFYTRIAMRNGVTRQELEELLFQAIPYTGFPSVIGGSRVIHEVIDEIAAEQAG